MFFLGFFENVNNNFPAAGVVNNRGIRVLFRFNLFACNEIIFNVHHLLCGLVERMARHCFLMPAYLCRHCTHLLTYVPLATLGVDGGGARWVGIRDGVMTACEF